ncbi:MAG: glutaminyl-peptide cyclotransferase [Planctomycetaceae bacterium]
MKLRYLAIPFVLLFAAGAMPVALLFAPEPASQRRVIPVFSVKVVAKYPHDSQAFTQGLVVDGDLLIEGTGQLGESTLREVHLKTGKVKRRVKLADQVFGEGVTVLNGKIYQLTWKHNIAYVYDRATMKYEKMHRYEGEGWGLTNDGKHLILSDGTDTLRFIDPATFKVHRRLRVRGENNAPLRDINELEFVKGEIFANIWYQDHIARINPKTGRVKSWLDLRPIRPQAVKFDREAALNGIAWDPKSEKLFVTGKDWPALFEIKIGPRSR